MLKLRKGWLQKPPFGTMICTLSSVTTSVQNSDSSLTVPTLPLHECSRTSGWFEIDFTSREIVREAIKFLRDAPQSPFQVLLGRFVRQSPGMIGLRGIVRSAGP